MVASGNLIDRGTPGTHRKPHICACGRTGRNLEIEQKTNSLKPGSAVPSSFLSCTEDYTPAAGSGNRFFAGDGGPSQFVPVVAWTWFHGGCFTAGCPAQELKASFPSSLVYAGLAYACRRFALFRLLVGAINVYLYEVPRVHLDGICEALSLGLDLLRVATTPDRKKESCVSKETRRTVAAAGLV
jgi:hypothetical protein